MTQHLEALMKVLQHEFTKTHTSQDYVEAIGDAIYGCGLGDAALNALFFAWSDEELRLERLTKQDTDYQQGVKFVKEQWEMIHK